MRRRCAMAMLAVAAGVLVSAAPAWAQLPGLPPVLGPGGGGGERSPERPGPRYTNPVMPGDYPDPSIIRDGPNYWMAVTSGGWRPPFTVLHSLDLVNWHVAGAVMRKRPPWAQRDFWAPEIVKRGDRFLVYYAARDVRKRHCVGVASANSPIEYFQDHGPVVCPKLGAIDPLAETDEHGRPYLIWKEDGNAKRRPTPIMAAPLRADGLRLAGPARELFRNDAPWEGAVVEAPTLARRGNSMYLLYSAGRCCGSTCDYVMGVARSRSLLGPWEKYRGPVLEGAGRFRCPGHSTVVDVPGGQQYALYHAYSERGSIDVGRQVLLDQLDWTEDGWPQVNDGRGPSRVAPTPAGVAQEQRPEPFTEEFRGAFLGVGWQWPGTRADLRVDPRLEGRLWLGTVPGTRPRRPGIVGRQPGETTFVAETLVGGRRHGATAGIGAYADGANAIGVEIRGTRVVVWRTTHGRSRTLGVRKIGRAGLVPLRIRAYERRVFGFEVGGPTGWAPVGAGRYEAPAWRGETRVILRVTGPRGARAAFERFTLGPAD